MSALVRGVCGVGISHPSHSRLFKCVYQGEQQVSGLSGVTLSRLQTLLLGGFSPCLPKHIANTYFQCLLHARRCVAGESSGRNRGPALVELAF